MLLPLLPLLLTLASSNPRRVLIDTDAGTDDLMAIAYLLTQPSIEIEAITVVSGVAHTQPGARNILRLLQKAGRGDIPVYAGAETTPNSFPEEWRKLADDLPTVSLPPSPRNPEPQPAAEFLAARFHHTERPVSVLALGPLTNLAAAFNLFPQGMRCIQEMVVMGGALRVPGNVHEGGKAEWNFYADPAAAKKVVESGVPLRLIPLDATNRVPIDLAYLEAFKESARTPLGTVVTAILESSRPLIKDQIFFAWDPLAAVAMVHPEIAKATPTGLSVTPSGTDAGRGQETRQKPNTTRAALTADSALFHKLFLRAFSTSAR